MSDEWADLIERRRAAGQRLATDADRLVAAAEAMAERFRAGATLLAFGAGVGACDANHIAVEFVHPVIVGKPALPALSLVTDAASVTGAAERCPEAMFVSSLQLLARPGDVALGVATDGAAGAVGEALREAQTLGLLRIALVGGEVPADARVADHVIQAWSNDPQVVKEVHVTAYHVLWELVHVFLEQGSELSVTA
jgi:D-sedoheptulose 7-phosphate isomerase